MTKTLRKPSNQPNDVGTPVKRPSLSSLLGARQLGPARWVLALAVFAAVMGASLGLSGVLRDMRWLVQAGAVVGGTLLVPALMRRYPALSPFAPIGALAGWLLSLTVVFFSGTAILGIIPTSDTVAAAIELSSNASLTIMSNLAPVPSAPSMHFVFSAGLGFAALLVDTLAITVAMPAASFLGLVLILLPAALTTRTGIGSSGLVGAAAGYLLILGCSRWYAPDGKLRTDTPKIASGMLAKATALGAAVVLVMTLVTAAIPGFTQGLYPQGASLTSSGKGGSLDPLLTLGADLRSQSTRVALRYTSSSNSPEYLRLTTLENFTGKVWEPSPLPPGLQTRLSRLSPAAGPAAGVPKARTTTQISVPGVGDEWLAAPLSVTDVQQLPGVWLWNPVTATIMSQTATTAGKTYLVKSEMPALTPELLNEARDTPRTDLDPIFSELPQDVPAIVSSTAASVTTNADSPYAKAMAIQDYLRSEVFTYSLESPATDEYDGSGMGVLADFLEKKRGYCVHFSAAMAVMSREVGIPSRIAVGYTAGNRAVQLDKTLDGVEMLGYEVAGRDAHAWPELYFEGLGWVPFEPTPSRGNVPDYAQEDFAPEQSPQDNPTAAPAPTATAAATTATAAATAAAGAQSESLDVGRWLAGAGWVVLTVAVLAVPAVLRVAIRRRRLALIRAGGTGVAPELLAWREVLATAADHGYVPDPALTPALQAAAMARFLGSSAPAGLDLVLHSYEHALYGTPSVNHPGREDLAEAALSLVSRFQSMATPWQRLRATLVPASFLGAAKS